MLKVPIRVGDLNVPQGLLSPHELDVGYKEDQQSNLSHMKCDVD